MDEHQNKQEIHFYEPKEPFYEFSNFHVAPFTLDGDTWQTVEHYFQASKFVHHPEYVALIRDCNTANKCFILAQQKCKGGYAAKWKLAPKHKDHRTLNEIIQHYKMSVKIREDWDDVRVNVMRTGLQAKFTQHVKLRALLLSTGDSIIVENSPRDSFWGIGKDGAGQNMLGKLLMEVREMLKKE